MSKLILLLLVMFIMFAGCGNRVDERYTQRTCHVAKNLTIEGRGRSRIKRFRAIFGKGVKICQLSVCVHGLRLAYCHSHGRTPPTHKIATASLGSAYRSLHGQPFSSYHTSFDKPSYSLTQGLVREIDCIEE